MKIDLPGDGDPREWGCRLPDGRELVHPPWGPVEIRRRRFRLVRRRPWWHRFTPAGWRKRPMPEGGYVREGDDLRRLFGSES